jgi:hypothetical protein
MSLIIFYLLRENSDRLVIVITGIMYKLILNYIQIVVNYASNTNEQNMGLVLHMSRLITT